MTRLNVVVEGQTEETFVRDLLAPELATHQIIAAAHAVTTSRKKGKFYRGGLLKYANLRRDLDLWMKQDRKPDARFSTMLDLYALPNDFPGFEGSRSIGDPIARARFLEDRLFEDLGDPRFVPYLQVHEFEALLFSDPSTFIVAFPDAHLAVEQLVAIATAVSNPELIDDGPETAPGKRIRSLLPKFAKPVTDQSSPP